MLHLRSTITIVVLFLYLRYNLRRTYPPFIVRTVSIQLRHFPSRFLTPNVHFSITGPNASSIQSEMITDVSFNSIKSLILSTSIHFLILYFIFQSFLDLELVSQLGLLTSVLASSGLIGWRAPWRVGSSNYLLLQTN